MKCFSHPNVLENSPAEDKKFCCRAFEMIYEILYYKKIPIKYTNETLYMINFRKGK